MTGRTRTIKYERLTIPTQALKCHRCHVYNPDVVYVTEGLQLTCMPCFFARNPQELTRLKMWINNPDYDLLGKTFKQ